MKTQSKLIRQLRGGQITIPVEFRRELGIEEDTLLRMTLEDGELRIIPVQIETAGKGSTWFKELYDYLGPARDEITSAGYTEDEVNADIEAAIQAVRAERD